MLGKKFSVCIEWLLPENAPVAPIGPKRNAGIFAMQQVFDGEEIGQVGLRFVAKKPARQKPIKVGPPLKIRPK